ncbi:hypothetical protein GPA19_24495 [Azoarcus indigens]|nr:hypothetical protein [Azoarcus indigens]
MRGLGRAADSIYDAAKTAIHHICTNKNCISAATGGPWTPRFEAIFDKAGMKLDDALNKIAVPGHKGPHRRHIIKQSLIDLRVRPMD